MKWAVIGTWDMAEAGLRKASELLKAGAGAEEAVVAGVKCAEDNPQFHSVGYGGFPDCTGHVTLDGGFMDGDTLQFGAVADLEGFASAGEIAASLKDRAYCNFLVGSGAELYARTHGFAQRVNLTPEALALYQKENVESHDTVCFIALDQNGRICVCTSTSGLKGKSPGRVGDTPMPGSGYYAVSEIGGAASTGVGEDISKGALSFQAVQLMKNMDVQQAAEKSVQDLHDLLTEKNGKAREMSLIALDHEGNFGAGTNVDFPFGYVSDETELTMFAAVNQKGKVLIRKKD